MDRGHRGIHSEPVRPAGDRGGMLANWARHEGGREVHQRIGENNPRRATNVGYHVNPEDREEEDSRISGQERHGIPRGDLDLLRRLEEMEKKIADKSSIKEKGNPFSRAIMEEELPHDFKMHAMAPYDGRADPEEHLATFRSYALLHRYSDSIQCRMFLTTLSRAAQRRFEHLPENSIHSFAEFSNMFLHQFSSSKAYVKSPMSLFSIKQCSDESLRSYFQRFTALALDAPGATPELKINAFAQGFKVGSYLFKSLAKKPVDTYE